MAASRLARAHSRQQRSWRSYGHHQRASTEWELYLPQGLSEDSEAHGLSAVQAKKWLLNGILLTSNFRKHENISATKLLIS